MSYLEDVFSYLKRTSPAQSEFYQAAASGLKPEIQFLLTDYLEYNNEKSLEFQGFSLTFQNLATQFESGLNLN